MSAALLAGGSPEPIGPGGWSGTSWEGLILYLGLFVLALWGISRLVGSPAAREDRKEVP